MIENRSVPAASVIPVLAYADVAEASDWLCTAFGFTERHGSRSDERLMNGARLPERQEPAERPDCVCGAATDDDWR